MQVRTFASAVTAAVLLSVPASAGAATKSVLMGTPPSAQKELQEKFFADINAFFPTAVTIRVGDSVRFIPVGFHTVDLPKKGGKPLGLVAPTGAKAAAKDAAGADFWFNGRDVLGFNPKLQAGAFGKTLSYDGSKARNSGLPLSRKPKPVTVRFGKTGAFTYFCNVHPGMKGTVRVVAKNRPVPSAAADRKRVAAQLRKAFATAKSLATKAVPEGVVRIGQTGPGGVERFAFAPDTLTVTTGTTVKFEMPAKSTEAHTATAGPGDPEKEEKSYLGRLAGSFQSPKFDPIATYPSEPPPAGVAALTPGLHGNGFWNSGILDAVTASPLPAGGSVRIGAPGKYVFYCLIHPFMKATVTAT